MGGQKNLGIALYQLRGLQLVLALEACLATGKCLLVAHRAFHSQPWALPEPKVGGHHSSKGGAKKKVPLLIDSRALESKDLGLKIWAQEMWRKELLFHQVQAQLSHRQLPNKIFTRVDESFDSKS